jgi:hypothetical protein
MEENYIDIRNTFKQVFEKKLGWGSIDEWTDKNFRRLSDEISEKHKITISHNTLKRFFNATPVKENYRPQRATEDTLAKHIGFKGWMDFVKKNQNNNIIDKEYFRPQNTIKWKKKNLIIGLIILTLFSFSLFIWYSSHNNIPDKLQYKISLSSQSYLINKPIKINYDFKSYTDDVLVFWDDRHKKVLPKRKNILYYTIRIPGYHYLYFETKGKVFDSIGVLIKTNPIKYGFSKNIGFYELPLSKLKGKSHFYLTDNELKEEVPAPYDQWLDLLIYKEFNISGDNFIFKTSVNNKNEYYCNDIRIDLRTKTNKHIIYFNSASCSPNIILQIGEKIIKGDIENLKALTIEPHTFYDVIIVNKDKQFNIYLNEYLIYSVIYQQDMGEIIGVKYSFKGNGEIKYYGFYDENDSAFYYEDFKYLNP